MARNNKKRGYSARVQKTAGAIAGTLDDLADYQLYKDRVHKWIRKDLAAGLSAGEIRKKYHAYVQARITTMALTDPDPGKALAAGKDHIDREEGRATERKEMTHRLENIPDEELRSILKSSEIELDELEDVKTRH